MPQFIPPEPAVQADVTVVEDAASTTRSWRNYEEALWWAVCFLAVAIILWRQLA